MTTQAASAYKILGYHLRESEKKTERAILSSISCCLEGECPLLKKGKCFENRLLGAGCVYGLSRIETSPTRRSNKYYEFVSKGRELSKEKPYPGYGYPVKFAEIGDYYILDYSQMNHVDNKKVPFVAKSSLFMSGSPFIKKVDLTPEVVVEIVNFRPYALMGGEITSYQKEEVPLFLFHLEKYVPELYQAAVGIQPSILEKTLNLSVIKSLKATLADIPEGETHGYTIGKGLTVQTWQNGVIQVFGDASQLGFFLPGFHSSGTYRLSFIPVVTKCEITITSLELIEYVLNNRPELLSKIK